MRKVVISVILWLSAIVAIFFMNLKQISQHQDVSYDFELQHVGSNDMQLQSGKYNITGADAFLIYDLGEEKSILNGKLNFTCQADKDILLQIFYAGEENEFEEKNSFLACISEGNDVLILPILKNKIRYIRIDFCVSQNENLPMIDYFYVAENTTENYWNEFCRFYHVGFLVISFFIVFVIVKYLKLCKIVFLVSFWGITVWTIFCLNLRQVESDCYMGDDYKLELVSKNNIEENAENYTITGDDAFLIFDLGEEKSVFNGKIYFETTCKENIQLQVFRAGEDFQFKEENSHYIKARKGEKSCIFPMLYDDIRYVRIDICENKSSVVSNIRYVTVTEKNTALYFEAFLESFHEAVLIVLFLIDTLILLCMPAIKRFVVRHEYLSSFFLILICAVLLYGNYLRGNIYYVFRDIARDSLDQVYPNLLHIADRIKNGEWAAGFDFLTALGDEQKALLIGLDNWTALFGREHIAYLMGVSQVVKVVLAGVFAYRFARLYGLEQKQGLLVGIGYAFNAEFIIRGAWSSYPNLALLLIIWLTAYEYTHVRKKLAYLPLATIIYFYSLDLYFCLFWGIALGSYIIFRRLSEEKASKDTLICCLKIEGIFGLFAFLGSLDVIVNKISDTLFSGRLHRNLNSFGSVRIFAELDEIMTAFLRTVGTSISGITWDYKGYPNFLDGAAFYCGILFFLLFPMSVFYMPVRKRKAYLVGVILFLIYLVIIPVRFMMNGFGSSTYKLNALCAIVFILLASMHGLKTLFSASEDNRKKNCMILNISTVIFIGIMIAARERGYVAREFNWWISIVFILAYDVLLNLLLRDKLSRVLLINMLCICAMTEAVAVSWDCINDRTVAVKEQVDDGGYYNNSYQKAIYYLKAIDTDFYRLEKKTGSIFLCDPLAQNYYGTTAYVGGIGVGMGLPDLYDKMGLPHESEKYLYGSGENIYADALFGVKYYLIENGRIPDVYGLTFMTTVEEVDIYKNELALPLMYMCDTVMSESDFMKYSEADRRKLLLENCVLNDNDFAENYTSVSGKYVDNRERIKVDAGKSDDHGYCIDIPENSVLIIHIEADDSDLCRIRYRDQIGTITSRYFHADSDNEIEICADVEKVWFEENENTKFHKIEFYHQNMDVYYKSIIQNARLLQENGAKIQYFGENYIKGRITCENNGMLITSIPYGEKWKVKVDGQEVRTFEVNTGFVGIELALGEHEVEFTYEHNSWLFDHKFKCIGLLLALSWLIVPIDSCKKRRKGTDEENIRCGSHL